MTGADAPRCYHARTRCLFCWPDTDGAPPKAPPKRGHCAACGRTVGTDVVAACAACAAKGAEARPLPARWPQRPPRRRRRPRTAS